MNRATMSMQIVVAKKLQRVKQISADNQ